MGRRVDCEGVCCQHGPCRAALLPAQVLLLSDYGLSAPTPRPRPLQPLKLPDTDPLLTHLAAESAAYWGGLQQLTGAPLLAGQQSLDVLLDPERDHAGATGFSKLQVCAGVCMHSPLRPTEAERQQHNSLPDHAQPVCLAHVRLNMHTAPTQQAANGMCLPPPHTPLRLSLPPCRCRSHVLLWVCQAPCFQPQRSTAPTGSCSCRHTGPVPCCSQTAAPYAQHRQQQQPGSWRPMPASCCG